MHKISVVSCRFFMLTIELFYVLCYINSVHGKCEIRAYSFKWNIEKYQVKIMMEKKSEHQSSFLIQQYLQFSKENHAKDSGTATSYVTALNKLNVALHNARFFQAPNESVWDIHDDDRLVALYTFVKQEQKKSDGGIFRNEPAKSYWKQGFCSAAVKDFARFLSLTGRQAQMLSEFNSAENGLALAQKLDAIKLKPSPLLLDNDEWNVASKEGKTAIREVEVRQNQGVFRKMILQNYHSQCCLTGLPIIEVLRASHISAWGNDKDNRMNPENGLCLSATYDAAFDRYLILLDEDYRLIFAPSLKDYCTNAAFKEQFCKFYGVKISMPSRFLPSQKLLEQHRNKLA